MTPETYYALTISGEDTVAVGPDGHARVAPTPRLTTLTDLVGRLATRFVAGTGVVVLADGAPDALGLPLHLPGGELPARDHVACASLRARGWNVTRLAPWMTIWRDGGERVHVWVPRWAPDGDARILGTLDPVGMARTLARYRATTGGNFHTRGGVAGSGLTREVWIPRPAPYWRPDWSDVDPYHCDREDVIGGWRSPVEVRAGQYLHTLDRSAAYLSAMRNAVVAADALRRTGPRAFDRRQAGWWLIETPAWNEPRIPHPFGGGADDIEPGRPVWKYTTTLDLLRRLGEAGYGAGVPRVIDSWTAQGRELLRGTADKLNEARLHLLPGHLAARYDGGDPVDSWTFDLVRASYQEYHGMITRETMRVHRPDWADAIRSTHRIVMWWQAWSIAQAGQGWPVAIKTDALTYATDSATGGCPHKLTHAGCDAHDRDQLRGLGQYKHEPVAVVDELPAGVAA